MKLPTRLELVCYNKTLTDERICVICLDRKALNEENFSSSNGYYRHECKPCRSAVTSAKASVRYSRDKAYAERDRKKASAYYYAHREASLQRAARTRRRKKIEALTLRLRGRVV